jgi:hypothetical protein
VKALLVLAAILVAVVAGPASARVDSPGGSSFITDTLGGNGGASPVTAPTATGFDWADAGIGASTAVGAIFVLIGGTLLVRRRAHVAI